VFVVGLSSRVAVVVSVMREEEKKEDCRCLCTGAES
jgi:hypothetical protein